MSENLLLKVVREPLKIPGALARRVSAYPALPDETALRLLYRTNLGRKLDLNDPKTFNEKLQWLKLHDRNPIYTTLVDKYRVKQWVADRIGEQYVTPTYAAWERVEDIDISELPERFVLKTNHDSGSVAICRDRKTFDLEAARKMLAKSLRRNFYWSNREWPYKDVEPLVFAEEYLDPNEGDDLADYKLFRFSGGRLLTLVCEDRLSDAGMSKTFFDEEWRALPVSEGGHPTNRDASRPAHHARMMELTDRLAEGMPFCRVDFYESARGLLFGEMTLYPNAGFERFDPASTDAEWGAWIDLSDVAGGGGGSW